MVQIEDCSHTLRVYSTGYLYTALICDQSGSAVIFQWSSRQQIPLKREDVIVEGRRNWRTLPWRDVAFYRHDLRWTSVTSRSVPSGSRPSGSILRSSSRKVRRQGGAVQIEERSHTLSAH